VQPETRYARLGQDRIAYQVFGQGPPDLVLAVGVTVDVAWEEPGVALWLRTLASFSRVILFDRRGSGASDPLPADPLPPWESFAEDLDAVMDAVGSERAAIFADLLDGPTALFFAGTRPERTSVLILVHTSAKFVASDDYPIGIPAEVAEALLDQIDQLWGTDAIAAMWVPSRAGDERYRRWLAKMQRATASPRAAQASLRAVLEVDVRPVLPLIQAPTLVLHRKDFHALPIEQSHYLAEHIAQAKSVLFTTSSARPSRPAGWATGVGASCWTCTTNWPGGWSRSSAASWSRPPVMGSWPPSTAQAAGSVVRPRSETSCAASASKSGWGCTPAKLSNATATSAVSRSTSRPE